MASSRADWVLAGARLISSAEQELREHRALQELERALLLVEDVAAAHVRGHEVGRELDAAVVAGEHLPEHAHEQGLAQARARPRAGRARAPSSAMSACSTRSVCPTRARSTSPRIWSNVALNVLVSTGSSCFLEQLDELDCGFQIAASWSAATPLPASRASTSMRITSPTGRPVRVATASASPDRLRSTCRPKRSRRRSTA